LAGLFVLSHPKFVIDLAPLLWLVTWWLGDSVPLAILQQYHDSA